MASRCWLCDREIDDPPRIIGRILAGKKRLAHIECLRYLAEVELSLGPVATLGTAGPVTPREGPFAGPGEGPTPPASPNTATDPGGQNP